LSSGGKRLVARLFFPRLLCFAQKAFVLRNRDFDLQQFNRFMEQWANSDRQLPKQSNALKTRGNGNAIAKELVG